MVSMTVSKSVGRDSSSLATEVINFYVNIKLLCRSSITVVHGLAKAEARGQHSSTALRTLVRSGLLRILVIHSFSKGTSPVQFRE